jgi:hypothetical protein
MNTTHETAAESVGAMVAKAAPPASVSLATIAGIPVSELVLWATLVYTVLMICHKSLALWRELRRDPRCEAGES